MGPRPQHDREAGLSHSHGLHPYSQGICPGSFTDGGRESESRPRRKAISGGAEMSGTNILDAQNPWPGLQAYTADDSRFFYGRNTEIEELLWLVRRNVLTVVFGAS